MLVFANVVVVVGSDGGGYVVVGVHTKKGVIKKQAMMEIILCM